MKSNQNSASWVKPDGRPFCFLIHGNFIYRSLRKRDPFMKSDESGMRKGSSFLLRIFTENSISVNSICSSPLWVVGLTSTQKTNLLPR